MRKLGPGDGNHLAGGVEFHGARAQRNHAAIQCQVFVAEAADVAQHGGFAMVAVKDGVAEKVRAALQTGRDAGGRCGVNEGWLLGTKQAQQQSDVCRRAGFIQRDAQFAFRYFSQVNARQ